MPRHRRALAALAALAFALVLGLGAARLATDAQEGGETVARIVPKDTIQAARPVSPVYPNISEAIY